MFSLLSSILITAVMSLSPGMPDSPWKLSAGLEVRLWGWAAKGGQAAASLRGPEGQW